MRNNKKILLIVILICGFLNLTAAAEIQNKEPNAADLVRAARESENWIHKIDSLQFRVEGKWSHPPESIAARRAELKKQSPEEEPDPNRNWELKPSFGDTLEYAIDFKNKRLRYLVDEPGRDYRLHVLNGSQLKRYAKLGYQIEQYSLYPDTKMLENLFGSLSWPRSQPHSFWWDKKNVDEDMKYFGFENDFKVTGIEEYRGVKCYVLEYESVVTPENIHRWYVGIEDHLLYGLIQGSLEHWTLDYKEIIPGCKIPTTQGYFLKRKDRDYVDFQRDAKIVDIHINEALPDELFQMEFKEGLPVFDESSGKLVIYNYVPKPVSLLKKSLPEMDNLGINLTQLNIENKIMLICFFDYQQRPSRNCIMQIARQSEQLKEQGIQIVTIQVSKIDIKSLNEWAKDNNINFPVGMIQTDEKKTKISWGVQSLPWLILTDKNHVVITEGFALNELNDKISDAEKTKL